jgi:hypothetical protein
MSAVIPVLAKFENPFLRSQQRKGYQFKLR